MIDIDIDVDYHVKQYCVTVSYFIVCDYAHSLPLLLLMVMCVLCICSGSVKDRSHRWV